MEAKRRKDGEIGSYKNEKGLCVTEMKLKKSKRQVAGRKKWTI